MKKIKTSKKEIRDLTVKQRAFLKRYFETGNATRSALETYDTDDYFIAASIASENLKKLQTPIKAYMESKGISLGKLVNVIDEGLRAKRIVTSPTGPDREIPDHHARHKYLDTAAKWLGIEHRTEEQPDNLKKRIVAEEFFEK